MSNLPNQRIKKKAPQPPRIASQKLHESLETFLEKVWTDKTAKKAFKEEPNAIEAAKEDPRDMCRLEREIYNIYTPYKKTRLKEGENVWNYGGSYHDIESAKVQRRIYMNVKAKYVKTAWKSLQGIFHCHSGVATAKYASKGAAKFRHDTIVIYLKTKKDVEVLLTCIRGLLHEGVLTDEMFEETIPPTTKPIDGLCGVSVAAQPLKDGWNATQESDHNKSFGSQLAFLVAKAFTKTKKEKGALNAFFENTAEEFHFAGIKPKEPWDHYFDQEKRTDLNHLGELAKKRRNIKTKAEKIELKKKKDQAEQGNKKKKKMRISRIPSLTPKRTKGAKKKREQNNVENGD